MIPTFQVCLNDVPIPETGTIERGLGLHGLRACMSLVWSRLSLRYFGLPLRYVRWGQHPEMSGVDESGGQGSVGHHLKSQALLLPG